MGRKKRRNDGPRVQIKIGNTMTTFLIDTGSPINVVDESTFKNLNPALKLDNCNTLYYGYIADVPLPIIGQFTTQIDFSGKITRAGFIVIKGDAECLLSYKTAQDLGVINININKINQDQQPKDDLPLKSDVRVVNPKFQYSLSELIEMFPNLFSGKLGCMKGVEVKLDIDETVRPTRQPQRPIAFHLRDAVEKEILKQVDLGILERVDEKSGPTPWVAI